MNQIIQFRYKNHRGEVSLQSVIPRGVSFMETKWHPGMQWILLADDIDEGELLFFALKDCNFVITS